MILGARYAQLNGDNDLMIGQYIIDAQNPSSELSQFFIQLKEIALKSENDRIRFGIFGAMEIIAMQHKADNSNKQCLDIKIQ